MTNKERYQRCFSTLHASESCMMEVKMMSNRRISYRPKLTAALVAAVLMLSLSVAAYATDFAGIRTAIQLWSRGEQTDAVLELTENGYELTYEGENGKPNKMYNFTIKEGYYGEERPMTEEEVIEYLANAKPEVVYKDDGSAWLYYKDQKIDISDKFDENGICKIKVMDKYITIRYQDGLSYSDTEFPDRDSFTTKPSK